MNQLYDLGYQEVNNFEMIEKAIKGLGAVLLDARYSPRSRNPQYNVSYLVKRFGSHYIHLKELGNKNYQGGAIEYVDFEKGIARLQTQLEKTPCVLMCGCWNRKTCHRYSIVFWLEEHTEIRSIPLTKSLCVEIAEANTPKQLSIF